MKAHLTDPNFLHRGQRAYLGRGLGSRRLTEPAMSVADLPALDAIVLSHLHGDNWEAHTITRATEALTMTSLSGIHARGVMGKILPPVMGTMLEHSHGGEVRRRIYLSGDTLTGDHLDVVRERYPQIDTAVVHLGGTRVLGRM